MPWLFTIRLLLESLPAPWMVVWLMKVAAPEPVIRLFELLPRSIEPVPLAVVVPSVNCKLVVLPTELRAREDPALSTIEAVALWASRLRLWLLAMETVSLVPMVRSSGSGYIYTDGYSRCVERIDLDVVIAAGQTVGVPIAGSAPSARSTEPLNIQGYGGNRRHRRKC